MKAETISASVACKRLTCRLYLKCSHESPSCCPNEHQCATGSSDMSTRITAMPECRRRSGSSAPNRTRGMAGLAGAVFCRDAGFKRQKAGLAHRRRRATPSARWQPFLATTMTARCAITGGTIAAINAGNKPENRDVLPKLCRQKGFDPGALN
jgi:hypothetical protein